MPCLGCRENGRAPAAGRGERGVALILVMVMLLLLSLLGMTLLTSTTTDLQISGDYRNDGNAFYVADAALQFAQVNSIIYSSLLPTPGNSWPEAGHGVKLNYNGTLPDPAEANSAYPDYNQITIYKDPVTRQQPQGTANVRVQYISAGPVPVGAGTEVDAGLGSGGFQAHLYLVSVIADGNNNSSHAEVESEIAKVVPK